MNEFFDISTLIFLALAVFVILRLRSVLGRRTGNERPPFDPYSGQGRGPANDSGQADKNVVEFPGAGALPAPQEPNASSERIDKIAARGSSLNEALKTILAVDRGFDPTAFSDGAKSAYEMVISAFASGDKDTLDMLLSQDVFESFSAVIDDRISRGEMMESTFVGIDKAEMVEAQLEDNEAQITIRFHSKLIRAIRNSDGEVVDGDPDKITDVVDLWTFARDISSQDPNWKLVATQSAE